MPECQSDGALNEAISEILISAPTRGRTPTVRSAVAYVRSVAELEYGDAVRKHFHRAELRQMYREMREALPTLNEEVYSITDVNHLGKIAKDLGVVLQRKPFKEPEGTGLRGFYVNDGQVLKRPLIWINTATHPTAVAAAFWHEVGHHLTNRMWDSRGSASSLSFSADSSNHFADAKEIAADMVRVLAGYPRVTARRLFGGSNFRALSRDVDLLVSTAIPHMKKEMGFNFQRRFSARENLYYLGGIIHVAKLRTTLLSEYGI